MESYEIRRSESRGKLAIDWLEARFSFSFGSYQEASRTQFGALRVLNEDWVQPASGFDMHPHRDMEIFMIPLSGAIAHADSLGYKAVIQPGEVLMMRAGAGIYHSQMNADDQAVDHHLQVWLTPRQRDLSPSISIKRFDLSEREGRWQLIASGRNEHDSLPLDQDAELYLTRPRHDTPLGYAPTPERSLYLHVASGPVEVRTAHGGTPERLETGDAMAWASAQAFTVTAIGEQGQELLLVDLPAVRSHSAT
ncbi:pirin family protein [Dyella choica]|uniref:Pirin family protein n=1 Tax=Dyella choica TaxID=1927959 RepID=A0A432M4M7_9GAMM|nr:pirin family protein [Dyella choica]RUL74476.1 pirin family protein [Dyella choica]